ncbi:hypothetical protein U91I_00437 [alpha proteobacterium U9-1i]|nr:hypothetical protein U91I_00437 [alpha proteobacterium U9-1i]
MDEGSELLLENLVSQWRGEGDYRRADGAMFICKTEHGAFLHELYAPATATQIETMSAALGFACPESVRALFSRHNGARLFDNSILIFAVVDEVIRGANVEAAQSVSLLDELQLFRAMHLPLWNAGWRPLGSIVVETRWKILVNHRGEIRVAKTRGKMPNLSFVGIMPCLAAVSRIFGESFSTEGVRVHSHRRIEMEVRTAFGQLAGP